MIGIIGAMEVEVEQLVERMEQTERQTIGSTTYFIGTLAGKDVVVAKCGIGKVNAAICAQTMILTYHPDVIVNTGVAGGVGEGVGVGDVVVATSVAQHDMDTTALGDPRGYLDLIGKVKVPCSEKVSNALWQATKSLEGVHGVRGVIVSGDQFINSADKKRFLSQQFDALGAEMEGASIGHVCTLAGTEFGVLRAISDAADGSSHMDFPKFVALAADLSVKVMLHFVAHYQ